MAFIPTATNADSNISVIVDGARAIAEAFGCEVNWDGGSQTVGIKSNDVVRSNTHFAFANDTLYYNAYLNIYAYDGINTTQYAAGTNSTNICAYGNYIYYCDDDTPIYRMDKSTGKRELFNGNTSGSIEKFDIYNGVMCVLSENKVKAGSSSYYTDSENIYVIDIVDFDSGFFALFNVWAHSKDFIYIIGKTDEYDSALFSVNTSTGKPKRNTLFKMRWKRQDDVYPLPRLRKRFADVYVRTKSGASLCPCGGQGWVPCDECGGSGVIY